MKKLVVLLFLITSLFANKVDTALKQCKKEYLYVLIVSNFCPWCHKFENQTLQDTKVKKSLQKDFCFVKLTRGDDSIAKKFSSTFSPSHYFLDKNGTIVLEDIGYKTSQEFLEILKDLKE